MNSSIAGRPGVVGRRRRWEALLCAGLISPAILWAAGPGQARAGQLPASDFTAYNPSNASSITPGPTALFTVHVDSIHPTQENEGLTEVGKKTAGFDLDSPGAGLQNDLLTDIEPVVIGPGGVLYLTDGHHTFTALENSTYGASNPTVFVNVIANYSNLTMAQFVSTMEANNFLLPINDGVATTVNPATLAPIPSSLTALTSDPYRGLEYSILKNKSSTLFPTTLNITGKAGASTPGLDKMTGFYSDFFEADAYRNANGGLGLAYLSPIDIAIATNWNLNPASTTTLPNVPGTVTAAQLPGFILAQNIVNSGGISNATLATGALDGNGGFTGITSLNVGTPAEPITIGTPNTGLILQLGADKKFGVTLNGTNTYTGGASILAGHLTVQSDASLGALSPSSPTIDPANVKTSVQAANGIIFNSLTEGAGTLTLGTTTGGSFSTNRPIAVGGETATIDVNDNTVTLTGQLVSLGAASVGIGNATGESDLTIDDLSSQDAGKLILSTASPLFYGNIIIGNTGAPTVEVMNDAALGNTTGSPILIGQIDLNSGTLQAGASFSAPERNLFLGSGSQIDVNGFATTWGTITDVQRTLEILNSNTTTLGAVTFNALDIGATSILQLAGGAGKETVTFTNGIVRTGNDTLIIQPTGLGTTEKVFSGTGAASLTNGIAPAWIVTTTASKGAGPYEFVTYGGNGYVANTDTSTATLNGTTGSQVIKLSGAAALTGDASVYALNTNGKAITEAGHTLTIGDGTHPAGLLLASGSAISGGALAFGASEGVIWLSGSNPTIASTITGTGGLTFAGSGTVGLGAQENVSGPITIDSGTVNLTGTNVFASNATGILMDNVKKNPAPATLGVSANNTLAAIVQAGSNAVINLSNGAALTLGDTTHNLSSTIMGSVNESGTATSGALTFNGSGLFDFSQVGKGGLALVSGSSIVVNNSAQFRVVANEFAAGTTIVLNGTSQLQFAQNGGGVFANTVSGAGELHLIGGTLQITGTSNSYSGGTVVEAGSTLDVTPANLPAINPNITNAGGLVLFDFSNATPGTYAGVISDGLEMGTGPLLSGSLDKDDSTGANGGDLILTHAQTYTGETYIEAGAITLNAVDTLASSSGVDLGRVGGGSIAALSLGANNTIKGLTSELGDVAYVAVGANTLTINSPAGVSYLFGGSVSGSGALVMEGGGIQGLDGSLNLGSATVTGGELLLTGGGAFIVNGLTVSGGDFDIADGALTAATANISGGQLELDSGTIIAPSVTMTSGALEVTGGALSTAALDIQGGGASIFGGSIGATDLAISGGSLFEWGGALTSSDVAVSGGGLVLLSGTVGANTTEVSGGLLAVAGGSYTTGPLTLSAAGVLGTSGGALSATTLNVQGGSAVFDGGTIAATDVAVSGGALTVGGGGLSATDVAIGGGDFDVTGGSADTGTTEISGGLLGVLGGSYATGTLTLSTGGVLGTIGGALSATSLNIQGGAGVFDGGTIAATKVALSGGTLAVGGGALGASDVAIGAGEFDVTSGSVDTDTTEVTGGLLAVSGGSYTTGSLTLSGGEVEVSGGAFNGAAATVSGGTLLVNGGSFNVTSLNFLSGNLEIGGGSLSTGALTLSSGTLTLDGGAFNAASMTIDGGTLEVDGASVTTSGPTTVSSGALLLAGGSYTTSGLNITGGTAGVSGGGFSAGATTISGGALVVDGGGFTASSATLGGGGVLLVSAGQATITGATTVSGGSLFVDGGTYATTSLNISSGQVEVDGGDLEATTANLSGGLLELDKGTIDPLTITVSSGDFVVNGGALTVAALNVQGGLAVLSGGTVGAGKVAVSSGTLAVGGGALSAGDVALSGGGVQVTGGSASATTAEVSGGTLLVAGGSFSAGSAAFSGGATEVTGGALKATAATISGGTFLVDGGAYIGGSTTITGGVVEAASPNAFTSASMTIGARATFFAPGGSSVAGIGALDNSGVLDIRNGADGNVFTIGAYTGEAGSQMVIGANLAKGTADRLVVASAAGSTQIVLANATPAGTALGYNPGGVPVVVSASSASPTAFTLAGGPIAGGLFSYDLAYNPSGDQFVLIGAPNADAYRLATLPTAAQSIWFDTTDSWQDHQSELRAAGGVSAGGASGAPGVWARAVGDWADRSQTRSFSDDSKSYTFQTGYFQTTGGFFGGVDKDLRLGDGGEMIAGVGGGYITSNQNFKTSPNVVTYQGPAIEASAAYLKDGLFIEGAFKADFLDVSLSTPVLAPFGNPRSTTTLTSFGAIGDAGYRWTSGRAYVEPIVSLAYVDSLVDDLQLAGTTDTFGDHDQLRGRIGISGGTTLAEDSHKLVQGALTASYWDRISGDSQATITSGAGSTPLALTDSQLRRFGEVGVSLDAISLTSGWSGFVKADYQFGTGFTGGDVKAGVRFRF